MHESRLSTVWLVVRSERGQRIAPSRLRGVLPSVSMLGSTEFQIKIALRDPPWPMRVIGFLGGIVGGELQSHEGPVGAGADALKGASMPLGDPPADHEPQPGASLALGRHEGLEEPLAHRRVDARSGIQNVDPDPAGPTVVAEEAG